MSLLVYKLLHIVGLVLLFTALGGLALHAYNGGSRDSNRGRVLAAVTHGIGLLLLLVSGFGMLARLGVGMGLWVWLKIGIWLVVGALVAAIRRLPQYALAFWLALPVLGALGAYLALYKP